MERSTRQRVAIREVIASAQRPLLPQEILDGAHALVPGLGLATVYRNLKSLVEDGVLTPVDFPAQGTRYELAHRPHHHHFQCLHCQRVFDVHGCPGDLRSLAPEGFEVESHEINLYGRCSDCRAGASARTVTGAQAGAGIGAAGGRGSGGEGGKSRKSGQRRRIAESAGSGPAGSGPAGSESAGSESAGNGPAGQAPVRRARQRA